MFPHLLYKRPTSFSKQQNFKNDSVLQRSNGKNVETAVSCRRDQDKPETDLTATGQVDGISVDVDAVSRGDNLRSCDLSERMAEMQRLLEHERLIFEQWAKVIKVSDLSDEDARTYFQIEFGPSLT